MVNWLHSVLRNPRRGWDPISADYAAAYSQRAHCDQGLVELLERAIGGYSNKRIVDLGSGPGHYAAEFARRGAYVTCIDVSATYLALVEKRMQSAGLRANLLLGYMDHLKYLTSGGFDGVFSNVSWCYCMNDLGFAKRILAALKPGGVALVCTNIERLGERRSRVRDLVYWLNGRLYIKVGHPFPPRGRVAFAFRRLGGCEVDVNYSNPSADLVLTRKAPP
jgi:SAM-dependent methyltransferase